MHEVELLKQQSQINRSRYESAIADTNINESVATKYLGYDPELRLAKLQDLNGNIFYGKADTNGAIALGEDVRLRRGYGIPGYDAMPHLKQPTESKTTETEVLTAAFLFYVKASHQFADTWRRYSEAVTRGKIA